MDFCVNCNSLLLDFEKEECKDNLCIDCCEVQQQLIDEVCAKTECVMCKTCNEK